ncbi:MAG: PfkB family carbohydrate kinase [Planctomycetota bacterium]
MANRRKESVHCVGTGFIALDVIRTAVADNVTLERRHAGGSCGNVLAILSYLGLRASAVGRIGDDRAGEELVADLRGRNVNVKFLVTEDERRTPIVIQESFIDSRGRARHRFSRECPVCGATMPGYRPLLASDAGSVAAALPEHGLFFFDRVAPGALALARASRKRGALVVFEPSGVKDQDLFIECLRVSHVLKYSHERLSDIGALVARARPTVEVETLGAEGLRYRMLKSDRVSGWHRLAALPAPSIRDAAGSGDWCTAGFMFRVAGGVTSVATRLNDPGIVGEGLRFGQSLAALNCAFDGARGLMYEMGRAAALRAATRLLKRGMPTMPHASPQPIVKVRPSHNCEVCTSDLRAARA